MFSIIKQGLKIQLKVRKWVIFNTIFPIFLMILLGTILSSAFSDSNEIENLNLCYVQEGDTESNKILDNFKTNMKDFNINYEKVNTLEEGKSRVRNNRDVFIYLKDNQIKVYYSNKTINTSAMVLSALQLVSQRSSAITEMYSINPEKSTEILMDKDDFKAINIENVKKDFSPSSYQYYGVVELTMMILYISFFPLNVIADDRRKEMNERLKLAGVSNFQYFGGRIVSSWILGMLTITPGFLFSIFALQTNWGPNPILTFMYLSAFILMMVSIGTLVGYAIKHQEKAAILLQGLVIPVLSFLGGAYVAFGENITGIFNVITSISPLRWLNKGVFQLVYDGKMTYLNTSLLISLSATSLSILALVIFLRRERRVS